MVEPWIALVGPEVEENLSLRYLAASLEEAGLRAEIFGFNADCDFSRIVRRLREEPSPPLLVGLSLAFQWRAQDFLALGMALRAGGLRSHITAGGHFATFSAGELLRDFHELDSICRFEAEHTLCELAHALRAGTPLERVPGLALWRDGRLRLTAPRPLPELAALPPPVRRGEPARCFGHGIMPLVGSRGCYGRCRFCCIAAWHEHGTAGPRFRLRTVEHIADEMAAEHRERGIEIFVFQDDNFFLPRAADSLERIHALGDALDARGVRRFATVVKARADDVRRELFAPLCERLHCIRAYVGIETDSARGLRTLGRDARREHNHRALEVVRELGLYICFNLLVFDPETTLADLEENLEFMGAVADYPFCVGRVELYAGTPLLGELLAHGRCRGDYLGWDYRLGDPAAERVFRLFLRSMRARNYGDRAAVVALWLLRFDLEACRFFHPSPFRGEWLERAIGITRRLSLDTVQTLRAIVAHVRSGSSPADDDALGRGLRQRCAELDREIIAAAHELAAEMSRGVGQDASLCVVRRMLEARGSHE
jgi:anaerobic magnesium-protoporphyrin IX monomethyl ester cyclase